MFSNLAAGGSLNTSYSQPRAATARAVHPRVRATFSRSNKAAGFTSTSTGSAAVSSRKS